MSIILKGIEMPKDIGDIISINLYDKKDNWLDNIEVDRKDIIEIPTPHGRLIDGDELLGFFMNHAWDWSSVDGITTTTALKQMISDLKHAPTIIEAED